MEYLNQGSFRFVFIDQRLIITSLSLEFGVDFFCSIFLTPPIVEFENRFKIIELTTIIVEDALITN